MVALLPVPERPRPAVQTFVAQYHPLPAIEVEPFWVANCEETRLEPRPPSISILPHRILQRVSRLLVGESLSTFLGLPYLSKSEPTYFTSGPTQGCSVPAPFAPSPPLVPPCWPPASLSCQPRETHPLGTHLPPPPIIPKGNTRRRHSSAPRPYPPPSISLDIQKDAPLAPGSPCAALSSKNN